MRAAQRQRQRSPAPAPDAGAGLSIVVPVYNEAGGLAGLHRRICAVAAKLAAERGLACEIVYVDDGSRDASLAVARGAAGRCASTSRWCRCRAISARRRRCSPASTTPGAAPCCSWTRDGQHPPDLIETLVGHWLDGGYDVVYTAKAHRDNEPALLRLAVKAFYSLINWGARQKIPEDAGDFRLLSPRAAAALRQLPERNRFFKGLASWIGFRQFRVDYEPAERAHGRTSWSLRSLIGLSVEGLTSFSVAPLRIASLLGMLLAAGALVFSVWILIETFVYERTVPGYPSLIVGIMVIGGVQLIMIGVMGEYIGKVLSELKGRPVYFVAEHSLKRADELPAPLVPPNLTMLRRAARPNDRAQSETAPPFIAPPSAPPTPDPAPVRRSGSAPTITACRPGSTAASATSSPVAGSMRPR